MSSCSGRCPASDEARQAGPQAYIVTKEHGLELLLGTYMQTGDCSGYPYYEKQDGGEGHCFLYYWKGDEPARAAGRFFLSNESPAFRV